jgi:hypothetical protein
MGVRALLVCGGVALATVVCWYAWLGHDTTSDPDASWRQPGPYTYPQVAGCVLTLVVIGVGAVRLRMRPWLVTITMTTAFVVPWTVQAESTDDSGLFMVGALFLVVGMGAATLIGSHLAWAALHRRRRSAVEP